MSNLRVECPACGSAASIPPQNAAITADLAAYRFYCAPCRRSQTRPADPKIATLLLDLGVRADPSPNPDYPPLGPANVAAEIQAFDPDLLLIALNALSVVDVRDEPQPRRRPATPVDADIEAAADRFDGAVARMRDAIYGELDHRVAGHGLDRWRDHSTLDPWALAETLTRACLGLPGDYLPHGHLLAARAECDRTGIFDPADSWVDDLGRAACTAIRLLAECAPDRVLWHAETAFQLAEGDQ